MHCLWLLQHCLERRSGCSKPLKHSLGCITKLYDEFPDVNSPLEYGYIIALLSFRVMYRTLNTKTEACLQISSDCDCVLSSAKAQLNLFVCQSYLTVWNPLRDSYKHRQHVITANRWLMHVAKTRHG